MTKKLILAAGLYRSGSTWQFNALRLILKNSNVSFYSCWEQDYDPENEAEYHLVKVHRFRKNLYNNADFVFTSFRDIDEIRISMHNRSKDKEAQNGFQNETRFTKLSIYIVDLLKYQRKSNFMLWYPQIKTEAKEVIKAMAKELKLDVDVRTVDIQLKEMKPPTDQRFDPVTLLHRNHITTKQ